MKLFLISIFLFLSVLFQVISQEEFHLPEVIIRGSTSLFIEPKQLKFKEGEISLSGDLRAFSKMLDIYRYSYKRTLLVLPEMGIAPNNLTLAPVGISESHFFVQNKGKNIHGNVFVSWNPLTELKVEMDTGQKSDNYTLTIDGLLDVDDYFSRTFTGFNLKYRMQHPWGMFDFQLTPYGLFHNVISGYLGFDSVLKYAFPDSFTVFNLDSKVSGILQYDFNSIGSIFNYWNMAGIRYNRNFFSLDSTIYTSAWNEDNRLWFLFLARNGITMKNSFIGFSLLDESNSLFLLPVLRFSAKYRSSTLEIFLDSLLNPFPYREGKFLYYEERNSVMPSETYAVSGFVFSSKGSDDQRIQVKMEYLSGSGGYLLDGMFYFSRMDLLRLGLYYTFFFRDLCRIYTEAELLSPLGMTSPGPSYWYRLNFSGKLVNLNMGYRMEFFLNYPTGRFILPRVSPLDGKLLLSAGSTGGIRIDMLSNRASVKGFRLKMGLVFVIKATVEKKITFENGIQFNMIF